MTLLKPQPEGITTPHPSAISQPYWDGVTRGELLFQRCDECGGVTHTPAFVCMHCFSTSMQWELSSGRGAIYSWSTVWRPPTTAFDVPYVAIVVDVEEGWQMLSNLIGCEHDAVEIGLPVHVEFHTIGDFTLPYFRPVGS
jgi:uncharacterized OB-fold protein